MRIQSLCKWPDNKLSELSELYLSGKSYKELSEMFHCSIATISNTLHRTNIEIRRKIHTINASYFNIINTPEKAYWFGFLAADGYAKRNHFVVNLKISDEEQLKKLKKALNSSHPLKIKVNKNSFGIFKYICFEFSNKKIVDDLIKHGLYKFKDSGIIPNIRNKIMNHFWRGYFDGDGYICFNPTGRDKKWPRSLIGFCGDKNILNFLNILLHNICSSNINSLKRRSNIYYLQYCGLNQTSRILNWLYNDSTPAIRLDRKYNIYQKIIRRKS